MPRAPRNLDPALYADKRISASARQDFHYQSGDKASSWFSASLLSPCNIFVWPCSHLSRFAFRSRSGPVPLVRVAFTPAKIDRTRSGCGPVTRSHLFRNATGTRTVTHTPSAHQVFNFWSVFFSEGDSVDGFASSTETVSYRWTDTPMHDVP